MDDKQIWDKIKKGVFIIAEAGKNFIQTEEEKTVEEYLENAKELVDKAALAGADAIKFQTHVVYDEQLSHIKVLAAHFKGLDRYSWSTRNMNATPAEEFWKPLKAHCEKKGIVFFSTPTGRDAAKRLSSVGVNLWKLASGDLLDFVLTDYLRNTNVPIIMSSGASTFEEVQRVYNFLREKNKRVAVVHALSKYPGKPEEANLAILELYRETFPEAPIGFSENSVGIEPSCIAVALGATIVEKHFSIRRDLWGADHGVCSTPEEFKEMVDIIRKIENDAEEKNKWLHHPKFKEIMGEKKKELLESEKEFRVVFQKVLRAGADMKEGEVLASDKIYAMRPRSKAKGLPSEEYENVLGKKVKKALKKYDPITEDVVG